MTSNEAILDLALIFRAENDALAANDAHAAAALLPQKQAAVAALRAATPATPNPAALNDLRTLAAENTSRLAFAIDVQSRILELVGRAARHSQPTPHYSRKGAQAKPEPRSLSRCALSLARPSRCGIHPRGGGGNKPSRSVDGGYVRRRSR